MAIAPNPAWFGWDLGTLSPAPWPSGQKVKFNNKLREIFPTVYNYDEIYYVESARYILETNTYSYSIFIPERNKTLEFHESFLDLVEGQAGCTCDTQTVLMVCGCQCGAFKQEKQCR